MAKYKLERPGKGKLTIITKSKEELLDGQNITIWRARGGRAVSVSAVESDAFNQLLDYLDKVNRG